MGWFGIGSKDKGEKPLNLSATHRQIAADAQAAIGRLNNGRCANTLEGMIADGEAILDALTELPLRDLPRLFPELTTAQARDGFDVMTQTQPLLAFNRAAQGAQRLLDGRLEGASPDEVYADIQVALGGTGRMTMADLASAFGMQEQDFKQQLVDRHTQLTQAARAGRGVVDTVVEQ